MGAARKLWVAGDLFCGGGGFSKGFALACADLGIKNVRLIAVNHSKVAVDTHKLNHPWAEHYCSRVDQLDPRVLVPEGRMKILIAAPECTNHANARGGRPINDQSRATAWDVVKWAQELYIETILIENVREIQDWGPLGADGRPLKSKKGEIFAAWTEAIRRCGYRLEHRILNAADFGGATTRQRFFLIARRGNHRVTWPEQTHAKDAEKSGDLFHRLKPWRGACEVIDWAKKGRSIRDRKKPLAANTIKRIEAGIRKFWGPVAEPFLVMLRGTQPAQIQGSARSTGEPLPTVTAGGIHAGLVEPFVVAIDHGNSNGSPRAVSHPLPTVMTKDRLALVEPFVIGLEQTKSNGKQVRTAREPIPSITTRGRIGLVAPFILQQQSGGAPRSVESPLPAIAGSGAQALVQPFIVGCGGPQHAGNPQPVERPLGTVLTRNHKGLVEPFIVPFFGERDGQEPRTHSIQSPLPAVTSHGAGALVEPFIAQVAHGTSEKRNNSGRVRSVRAPLTTITGENSHALVEPFLVKYHRTGKANSIRKPLPTVTGRDRCGLVEPTVEPQPDGYVIDILFRMLEPDELARAMGFDGYEFSGTKKQRVLMIGNAVEVNTAKALIRAILVS